MDLVLGRAIGQSDCATSIGNTRITYLDCADKAVLFVESLEVLDLALEALHEDAKFLGLQVS